MNHWNGVSSAGTARWQRAVLRRQSGDKFMLTALHYSTAVVATTTDVHKGAGMGRGRAMVG